MRTSLFHVVRQQLLTMMTKSKFRVKIKNLITFRKQQIGIKFFFNLHMEQYILCFSIRKVRYFVLLYTYRYLCFAVCCYASHSHAFSRNSFFASQLMDCWKNFLLLLYKLFFWTKMKVAARLKRERKILNFFMVIVG